jgi:DNA mismatch repair protein MutS2
LRGEIDRQRTAVHRLLETLIRSKALEHALQEPLYTLRGHRYVLPIKTDFRGHVPGIVHDVSASGATLFIEPHAVVEETNALALLEKQLDLETQRILRDLSLQVGYAAPSLRHNLGWLGRLDLLHAQARLSEAMHGTAPEVWSEGRMAIRGLAHPLLLLAGAEVVRNDFALGGESRCLVISGANSGGKTVLLKAVGLCALLVGHGMHIPALGGSRMDWFPHVWGEVGDPQDLGSALSTFSARIRFLADALAQVGPGHLVLLDELLSGTEPQEGAALASQVVRDLVDRGAVSIVSTHYGD